MNSKEKLMYEVMKAIYELSMPICFKGSMVLKACLLEAGYVEEVRHTVDIDANWKLYCRVGRKGLRNHLAIFLLEQSDACHDLAVGRDRVSR